MSRQVFATRLHPEERALVAAAARAVGLAPSGFLRQAALREAALIVVDGAADAAARLSCGRVRPPPSGEVGELRRRREELITE